MLVLTRRKGESIRIGDNVVVSVVEVRGNSVKLAFDAESQIPIHRGEVFVRLKQQPANGEDARSQPVES